MIDIRYCQRCLKNGCRDCRAVEEGELCAFCEDGQPCPTAKRLATAALQASAPPVSRKGTSGLIHRGRLRNAAQIPAEAHQPTKEETMAKKVCACGCGEEVSPVREYKNGHRPKKEKKAKAAAGGGRTSVPRKKPVRADAPQPAGIHPGEAVVSIEALDNWFGQLDESKQGEILNHLWDELSAQQKVAVFTREVGA